MLTCRNGGREHQHATVLEARVCYGLASPIELKKPEVPFKDQPGTMSEAQERYIKALGAKYEQIFGADGMRLSMNAASRLITDLKSGRVSRMTESPLPIPEPVEDRRVTVLRGMFDMVPNGYFAVQPDSETPLTFIRVTNPKTGKYRGCRKIQTQHGPRLDLAVTVLASGKWVIHEQWVLDPLMLLVANYQDAALRYGVEMRKCSRCNAALTDERSRHYSIGPECEKYWPWVIEYVDDLHDGVPFRG